MNAAKILVEMLLGEAQVFGLVFGPRIPETGYWVQGNTFKDMVGKIATGLGGGPTQQSNTYLNLLISSGYTLVTDDAYNRISVFGLDVPELTDKALRMLKCTATTAVEHYRQAGGKPILLSGKDAFGIDMTPEERAQLQTQKVQAKEKARQNATNLSPEEEDEFNRWMMQSGKSRIGLTPPGVSMPGNASAVVPPAKRKRAARTVAAPTASPAPPPTP